MLTTKFASLHNLNCDSRNCLFPSCHLYEQTNHSRNTCILRKVDDVGVQVEINLSRAQFSMVRIKYPHLIRLHCLFPSFLVYSKERRGQARLWTDSVRRMRFLVSQASRRCCFATFDLNESWMLSSPMPNLAPEFCGELREQIEFDWRDTVLVSCLLISWNLERTWKFSGSCRHRHCRSSGRMAMRLRVLF